LQFLQKFLCLPLNKTTLSHYVVGFAKNGERLVGQVANHQAPGDNKS
jgi:hypothetical protein